MDYRSAVMTKRDADLFRKMLRSTLAEKHWSQAAQKDLEARRVKIDKRRRTLVR